jgi:lipoprotein signal peptidase
MVGPPARLYVWLAALYLGKNEPRAYGGLKMSMEMISVVAVIAVLFIVVSWILQKSKSKKS